MGGAAAAAGCYGEWGAKESRGFHPLRTPPHPTPASPRSWGLHSAPSDPASYSSVPSPLHDVVGTRANSNLRISVL